MIINIYNDWLQVGICLFNADIFIEHNLQKSETTTISIIMKS